jgi:hypothetical protein
LSAAGIPLVRINTASAYSSEELLALLQPLLPAPAPPRV